MVKKDDNSRTRHMTPSEKFEHYFNLRMRLLKSALRGVGYLSNRNTYEVPDKAQKIVEDCLKKWSKEFVYDKWNRNSKKKIKIKIQKIFMSSILKNKIRELMHLNKKRLSYTVGSYIDRTLTIPLARVHPGFVLCLCSKVAISKLTMQILMRAKLHLSFFLCSLYALKITTKEFN